MRAGDGRRCRELSDQTVQRNGIAPRSNEGNPNGVMKATPVVFVVDDDVSVRESLEALIATAGWRTKAFASALDFLDNCRETSPRCLVLDVSLPGLSGLDLQQRLGD